MTASADLIDAEALCATLSKLNPFPADPNLHNQAGLRDVDCTRVRLRHADRGRQGRGLSTASGQTPLSQTQSNGGARPPEQGHFHMLKGFSVPLPPQGKSTLATLPPWHYSSECIAIEFWADGLAVDESSAPSQAREMAQIMPDVAGD